MVKKSLGQALAEISDMPKKAQPEALQKLDCIALRVILKHALDPKIKFLLPEGETPFDPVKDGSNEEPGILHGEVRRLYLFIEGGHATLKPLRREQLWVEFLKGLTPEDAKLMDLVKDKKLPLGIPKKSVVDAFPNILD